MDIAVLAGGRSPEHDVSLRSAAQVLQNLDRTRWRVWPVYLDRDGGWCWVQSCVDDYVGYVEHTALAPDDAAADPALTPSLDLVAGTP